MLNPPALMKQAWHNLRPSLFAYPKKSFRQEKDSLPISKSAGQVNMSNYESAEWMEQILGLATQEGSPAGAAALPHPAQSLNAASASTAVNTRCLPP
jgi:hypothetical protein